MCPRSQSRGKNQQHLRRGRVEPCLPCSYTSNSGHKKGDVPASALYLPCQMLEAVRQFITSRHFRISLPFQNTCQVAMPSVTANRVCTPSILLKAGSPPPQPPSPPPPAPLWPSPPSSPSPPLPDAKILRLPSPHCGATKVTPGETAGDTTAPCWHHHLHRLLPAPGGYREAGEGALYNSRGLIG